MLILVASVKKNKRLILDWALLLYSTRDIFAMNYFLHYLSIEITSTTN